MSGRIDEDQVFRIFWREINKELDAYEQTAPRPKLTFDSAPILSEVWKEAVRDYAATREAVSSLNRWLKRQIDLYELPELPSPEQKAELNLDLLRIVRSIEFPRCPLLREAFSRPTDPGMARTRTPDVVCETNPSSMFGALMEGILGLRDSKVRLQDYGWIYSESTERKLRILIARVAIRLGEIELRRFEQDEYIPLARALDKKLAHEFLDTHGNPGCGALVEQDGPHGLYPPTLAPEAAKNGRMIEAPSGPPVELEGPDDEVIVWGKSMGVLPDAEYRVVSVLVDAYASGERLSINVMRNRTKDARGNVVEDPVGALKRLRRKSPIWKQAIEMSGKACRGYTLNAPARTPPTETQ